MKQLNLALVDDDQLVIELLSDFFSKQPNVKVTLTATSGNSFINQLQKNDLLPDIVLLDLRMDDGDGLEVTQVLKTAFPSIKIIVLSSHVKNSFSGFLLKLGVNAFLPKRVDKQELLSIVYEVFERDYYFSNEQIELLRNQIASKVPTPRINTIDKLNTRELEVLELICHQHTAKEIADKLCISVKAIESRKSNLLSKLGVKNTAGLIVYAIQHKLVDVDSIVILE